MTGTVVKQGQVLLSNVSIEYKCPMCNESNYDSVDCENCGYGDLKQKEKFESAISTQIIRIQDIGNSENISETLEVCLKGDWTGKYYPGQLITVTGIAKIKLNRLKVGEKISSTVFLDAYSVFINDKSAVEITDVNFIHGFRSIDKFATRAFFIKMFSREIGGLENVKLGLMLAMCGGSAVNEADNKRKNIHVLLVGEASTGKTTFLRRSAECVYPSILTNGTSTTDAGLTTCAVKQGREWTLEAGALVLADLGLCCIDELDCLRTSERSGLLEVMEQQTLSVAKAGLCSTINARCTVFGTASSKFRYGNVDELISTSTLGSALVTRFDLIFKIDDKKDLKTSELILARDEMEKQVNNIVKTRVCEVRNRIVQINDINRLTLKKYYAVKRRMKGASEYFSIRFLEGLVRVCEAHCKMVEGDEVDEFDVFSTIILMETCLGAEKIVEFDDEKVFVDERLFMKVKDEIISKLK